MKFESFHLSEPVIEFGHKQSIEDPRDGLTLFGPLDQGKVFGIRAGVIGTKRGIQKYIRWAERMSLPILNGDENVSRPSYPGFETVFGIPWNAEPTITIELKESEINRRVGISDRRYRVYEVADLFSTKILDCLDKTEESVDLWFVVIPDYLKQYCRPESALDSSFVSQLTEQPERVKMSTTYRRSLSTSRSLFEDENRFADAYSYEPDFRNQLKARLLEGKVVTQIILERTITDPKELNAQPRVAESVRKQQSAIAWNLGTAIYYKHGARPWKLGSVRRNVCYVGMVFKRLANNLDRRMACCAAQMFLESGDGVVFKGAVGKWYNEESEELHLDYHSAHELIETVVQSYKESLGIAPSELFIHGRHRFNQTEWDGFLSAVGSETNLVGIRIGKSSDLKFFTNRNCAVLRGTCAVYNDYGAYLWTNGFIPRIRTQQGLEVPNPLRVDIVRGQGDIKVVANDILALTKLNYNACIFADSLPVTLRFADSVGEILTSGPDPGRKPLAFRHYI
jgi:hypothetical protein